MRISDWSSDVCSSVSDNLIVRGDGEGAQGIFLRDQLGHLPYEHVTISNNAIAGTGYNGIRVIRAKHLTVTGNELATEVGGYKTFMLVQNADDVNSTGTEAISIGFAHVTTLLTHGDLLTNEVAKHGTRPLTQARG